MTMKKSTVPVKRVPRPIIALAAPSAPQPTTTIERKLKGGELSWGLTAPGPTIEKSIERALAAGRQLIIGCLELEALERSLRTQQADLTAQLEASIEKVKAEKKSESAQ
jgi:hypothetical protein